MFFLKLLSSFIIGMQIFKVHRPIMHFMTYSSPICDTLFLLKKTMQIGVN